MNMKQIELKYFKSAYVDKIYRDLINSQNFSTYEEKNFEFDKNFVGNTGINIEMKDSLDASKTDIENSILLFSTLKNLTEVQASDERLWTYLSHVYFWEYMRERWPAEKAEEPINRIKNRYFLRNLSLRSITRNGLSRLWWYAYLTYRELDSDPYRYLRVLLKRQDLVVGITERALGANENIRFGLLEFLEEQQKISSNENASRKLITDLSLAGGVKLLPCMEKNSIKELLYSLI